VWSFALGYPDGQRCYAAMKMLEVVGWRIARAVRRSVNGCMEAGYGTTLAIWPTARRSSDAGAVGLNLEA